MALIEVEEDETHILHVRVRLGNWQARPAMSRMLDLSKSNDLAQGEYEAKADGDKGNTHRADPLS